MMDDDSDNDNKMVSSCRLEGVTIVRFEAH